MHLSVESARIASMEQIDNEVGKIVRGQREEALMSQADLADRMRTRGFKWSQATVWSVETGERQLRLTEAAAVGEACGFDPVMFFGNYKSAAADDRYAEGVRRGIELSQAAISRAAEGLNGTGGGVMAGKAMDIGAVGERFARNVTAVRTAKRMTYTELSALLSDAGRAISPLAVRRIEAGERKADVQDIASLSEVLGVSVEQLLFSDVEVTAEYKVGQ